jgi:hypothetical protein
MDMTRVNKLADPKGLTRVEYVRLLASATDEEQIAAVNLAFAAHPLQAHLAFHRVLNTPTETKTKK